MAQYKTGSADVTNGSAIVTGVSTLFTSNVSPADAFTVAGDGILYDVASVDSDTQITLSAPYQGVTATGVTYTIARDFTTPDNFPELVIGDIETPTILTRAIRKIQSKFNTTVDQAAISNAEIYLTVTDGLANTVDGDLFFVADGTSYILYENSAGSAIEKVRFATFAEVEQSRDEAEGHSNDAENFANAAESAKNSAESLFDQFGDTYLGSHATDPTTDNDGDPLNEGDIYWNSTDNVLKFYTGTAWVAPEDIATTAASNAQTYANSASTSASEALTSENNAETSATESENWASLTGSTVDGIEYSSKHYSQESSGFATDSSNSADAAATSEGNALASENKAQGWADAPLGTEVETGKYSARHWAEQLGAIPETAYNWQGAWSVGTYNAGDAVFHTPSGSSYITLVTTSDEPDIDGLSDWELLAKASQFQGTNFTSLGDTPNSYPSGSSEKFVQVNSTEDGLIFSTVSADVESVNGQTGVVSLDTGDITEGTNLYYTDARAQGAISVSGDLTYSSGVIGFNETYSTGVDIKTAYEGNVDTNAFTDGEKSKLTGIETGATANSTDSQLRDRATHIGTQGIVTISGLQVELDSKEESLVEGSNITIDRTDPSNPIISSSGGGVTKGTLTASFTTGQQETITLSEAVSTPVVSATKETPQLNLTNQDWFAGVDGAKYDIEDHAPATSVTPSATTGFITLTLGSGTFTTADVGRTVAGNGGSAVVTATDGSAVVMNDFTDTSAIAFGGWALTDLVFDVYGVEVSNGTVGFDLAGASYNNVSFSVANEDSAPLGITFNNDGTKLFMVGNANKSIYQYSLTTAFDLNTISYDNVSFSVSNEEGVPFGIAFNNDGTKLYMVGTPGDSIHQYSLTTAFDLNTISYDNVSFSVNSEDGSPSSIAFNNHGTKLYMVGSNNDSIHQYSLTTAFDLNTISYDNVSFSIANEDGTPIGITFNNDGTKLYMVGTNNDSIYQYSLTTAFDLNTISYDNVSFSVNSEDGRSSSIAFNNHGTKLYMVGLNNDSIHQYSTGFQVAKTNTHAAAVTNTAVQINSTFWTDINNMTATEQLNGQTINYAVSTDGRDTFQIVKAGEGVRNIVRNNGGVWEVNDASSYPSETWVAATVNSIYGALSEAMIAAEFSAGFSLVNAAYDNVSFSVASEDGGPLSIAFNNNGTKLYMAGTGSDSIHQYSLTTAFDLNTISYDNVSFSIANEDGTPIGITFNNDGTKLYMVGTNNDSIYQYSLTTAFDLNTISYDNVSFSVVSEDNGPQSITFNNDGTKLFMVGIINDSIHQYSLTTAFDLNTISYDNVSFSIANEDGTPIGITFNNDGTKLYMVGTNNDSIYQYSLTTAFDLNTISYDNVSFSVVSEDNGPQSITFNNDGTKLFMVGNANKSIYQYSTTETFSSNTMPSTQLAGASDAEYFALSNTLDLAIILFTDENSSTPSSKGVAINYDANVLNKGAVNGTDYEFDFPDTTTVRIKALQDNNLKVRIV